MEELNIKRLDKVKYITDIRNFASIILSEILLYRLNGIPYTKTNIQIAEIRNRSTTAVREALKQLSDKGYIIRQSNTWQDRRIIDITDKLLTILDSPMENHYRSNVKTQKFTLDGDISPDMRMDMFMATCNSIDRAPKHIFDYELLVEQEYTDLNGKKEILSTE